MNKTIYCLFLGALLISCKTDHELEIFDYLTGTWKVENKESYEVWRFNDQGGLDGEVYTIKNDVKKISETISLKRKGNKIIYAPTVPNQNQGRTIDFVLNNSNEDQWSFENINHDFPKKIIYQPEGKDKLKVSVLGENDEGFIIVYLRQ